MNDVMTAGTGHSMQDLVKMLDIILTDAEWSQLVNTIRQYDRERRSEDSNK